MVSHHDGDYRRTTCCRLFGLLHVVFPCEALVVMAQYELGMMDYIGEGVSQDNVKVY